LVTRYMMHLSSGEGSLEGERRPGDETPAELR
jgi:hypothetical protein